MAKVVLFPVIEALLKEKIPLYSFVFPEAKPPYGVYEEGDQNWGFPDVTRGTLAFTLKVISTYKGAREINDLSTQIKQKLDGKEALFEAGYKGLFRFLRQEGVLQKDAITRENLLTFQVLVSGR